LGAFHNDFAEVANPPGDRTGGGEQDRGHLMQGGQLGMVGMQRACIRQAPGD